MLRSRILVVDDEESIVKLVTYNLKKEGFDTETAFDGQEALDRIRANPPDLVILDLMLPEVSGLDVCRIIRKEDYSVPVLMLTAKDAEVDRVLGLEMGADDYLTKPFSQRELIARVRAILRRTKHHHWPGGHDQVPDKNATSRLDALPKRPIEDELKNLLDSKTSVATGNRLSPEEGVLPPQGSFTVGDITMDMDRHEATVAGEKIDLTPKEFDLLLVFIKNPGRVLTRDFLLNTVWGYDFYGDARVIDVHVSHLRDKIERDPSNPQYLKTVRGVGYRLER